MNSIIVAILSRLSLDTIIEYLLKAMLKSLPGVWAKAKELVTAAEARFPAPGSGTSKGEWVRVQLTGWLYGEFGIASKSIKSYVLDVVIGLAVADLQKQLGKLIGLSDAAVTGN